MAKKDDVNYHNPTPFDNQYKERRKEICDELSTLLRDQDQLSSLSDRLFKNNDFISKLQGFIRKDISLNKNERWIAFIKKFFSYILVFVLGGALSMCFGQYLINKLFG